MNNFLKKVDKAIVDRREEILAIKQKDWEKETRGYKADYKQKWINRRVGELFSELDQPFKQKLAQLRSEYSKLKSQSLENQIKNETGIEALEKIAKAIGTDLAIANKLVTDTVYLKDWRTYLNSDDDIDKFYLRRMLSENLIPASEKHQVYQKLGLSDTKQLQAKIEKRLSMLEQSLTNKDVNLYVGMFEA